MPRRITALRFPAIAATCLAAITLAGSQIPTPALAQGDLLIAPTRLVLDGRRGGEVILSNIGNQDATYRITLSLRRMNDEGQLEEVDEAEITDAERAALAMVRYAPRRVTLPPDQPQSIRISARPGPELPDGEYRVHMSFDALPRVSPVSAPAEAGQAEGIAIRLTPIYGITMPIIVRKGQLQSTASLANARIEQGPNGTVFAIDVTRQGTASVYGDLMVYKPGAAEPVFLVRGIGVYPEIPTRKSSFSILPEQAVAMKGPVRIEFREAANNGGGLLATSDTVLR